MHLNSSVRLSYSSAFSIARCYHTVRRREVSLHDNNISGDRGEVCAAYRQGLLTAGILNHVKFTQTHKLPFPSQIQEIQSKPIEACSECLDIWIVQHLKTLYSTRNSTLVALISTEYFYTILPNI